MNETQTKQQPQQHGESDNATHNGTERKTNGQPLPKPGT